MTVEEGEEGKVDDMEKEELEAKAFNEKPPKSKEGFRNHPKFALKSQFKAHEVLKPNATKKVRFWRLPGEGAKLPRTLM